MRKKIRIGDLLVQHGLISEPQLQQALKEQKSSGHKLGKTLIQMGLVTEDQLLQLLSKQLQIPFVNLTQFRYKDEVVRLLSETYARRFRSIVLDSKGGQYLVAMADPTDLVAYDELTRILRRPMRLAVVRETDLLRVMDVVYRRTEDIQNLAIELQDEMAEDGDETFDLTDISSSDESSEAPVVKLLQNIFEDAVQIGASDIHIEPDDKVLRIRHRVDGVLQEQIVNERRIAPALVLRLKLVSGLNISEKRLPQDGRFNVKVKNRSIDVRISTMPVQNGESVVMRLLDHSEGGLRLDDLGMPMQMLQTFRQLMHRPHGMILVTGPTGSGKTTTLYAALNELNQAESKIITIEDPVEYRLPRINQVQVAEKIELNFARVLRSALRQDPDIVMVGEMRDEETARIGLRAAITGHLVFSTLHTNDAIGCAMRLVDMGTEAYMVASALRAVIAQRLVRRLCDGCVQPYQLSHEERVWLQAIAGEAAVQHPYQRGVGCPRCNNTGYRGRIGVYELLAMDQNKMQALRRDDPAAFVKAVQEDPLFRPLYLCALDYAQQGVTSIEEVFRVAESLDSNDHAEAP